MKRFLIVLFSSLFLAVLVFFSRMDRPLSFSGVVTTCFIPIHTQVNGQVLDILIKPGDQIDLGKPVLHIDRELQMAKLKYAEALNEEAQKKLILKELELSEATQMYIDAQASQDSQTKQKTFHALEKTQAEYNTQQAHINSLIKQKKLTNVAVNKGVIRAPIKGIIHKIYPQKGSYVKEDDIVGILYDPENIWVQITLNQNEMKKIIHKKQAKIQFRNDSKELVEAKVESIVSKNSEKTSQVNILPSRTAPKEIKPGMKVKVFL